MAADYCEESLPDIFHFRLAEFESWQACLKTQLPGVTKQPARLFMLPQVVKKEGLVSCFPPQMKPGIAFLT